MYRIAHAVVHVCLYIVMVRPASAQPPVRPLVMDLSVGAGSGRRVGPSKSNSGLAASALLAWHVDSRSRGALVTAFSASVQTSFATTADCVLRPDGGCAQDFPDLSVLALSGGWGVQRGQRGPSLRVLLGPALVRMEQSNVFGVQSRVDLASASWGRVAAVGWLQLLLMPDLFGERARTQTFGVGIRVR
jgi:hypothetical protein